MLCVGVGGLGSPLATYLAAAGVGTLGLCDHDRVEESNLHRQPLHFQQDLGSSKVDSALWKLEQINPHVTYRPHREALTVDNALDIIGQYDIVADGTDNFATRYLINDACVILGKPNVHAAVFQFHGQVSVFDSRVGPCYRCLFPTQPAAEDAPNCAEAGVLGVVPGILGTLQAGEVIKLILGIGRPLIGRLQIVDVLEGVCQTSEFARDPDCPACGEGRTITQLGEYGAASCLTVPRGPKPRQISAAELMTELSGPTPPILIDVREADEVATGMLPNAHHIAGGRSAGSFRKEDHLVAYCLSGARSEEFCRTLAELGYRNVRNLEGGILAWQAHVGRGGQATCGLPG